MNSNFLLRSIRIALFPFSVLYGIIIKLRNWLYKVNFFKSVSFNMPIINVGNLSVGGTGKSPMVTYLAQHLQHQYQLAILSRGYKRKTKGFLIANANTTALDIGDEPFLYYTQLPNVAVAVCENRVLAVPQLLQLVPNMNAILLDDALQHRAIVPNLNIVLTSYHNLYIDDYFLPTGDLRDERSSIQRAHIVVITKCPTNITTQQQQAVISKLALPATQSVYFSTIIYASLYGLFTKQTVALQPSMEILIVTGIANPLPLEEYLVHQVHAYYKLTYSDHHLFTTTDIKEITKEFAAISATKKIIITTEKDAVRLTKFGNTIAHLPIYVLPMQLQILPSNNQYTLVQLVQQHIQGFK